MKMNLGKFATTFRYILTHPTIHVLKNRYRSKKFVVKFVCKAVQNGDKWIINGQKVWTSGAHFSDYGILVVRHDPNLEKHKGMTFFFVDMKSPGIEIKPIKQITGGSSFNEVYFTDVEIPDTQRLGEIGDGWKVAITTLMNERLAVGDAGGADGVGIAVSTCF